MSEVASGMSLNGIPALSICWRTNMGMSEELFPLNDVNSNCCPVLTSNTPPFVHLFGVALTLAMCGRSQSDVCGEGCVQNGVLKHIAVYKLVSVV